MVGPLLWSIVMPLVSLWYSYPLSPNLIERENNMKKYLIAAALILCAPQPILAQEAEVFYVILDNTTNQCRVMAGSQLPTTQKARYKELGKYATVDEAKAALDSMIGSACPKM